jgi:hypothetical protein
MSIAAAYNAGGLPPGITGAGHSIYLIEFDSFNQSDVANWLNAVRLPAGLINNLVTIPMDGGTPPSGGRGTTEVLGDIDTVLGIAPGAIVDVIVGQQSASEAEAISYGLSLANPGDIISDSWYSCESEHSDSDLDDMDNLVLAAGLYGVSVF